jgi:hypothetical protein
MDNYQKVENTIPGREVVDPELEELLAQFLTGYNESFTDEGRTNILDNTVTDIKHLLNSRFEKAIHNSLNERKAS